MKNVVIASFESYNERRYSAPWVAKITQGQYQFKPACGLYTGDRYRGTSGDLVVYEPEEGQVYAYGQKDHRGKHTYILYALWDGARFVPCDKIGRPL